MKPVNTEASDARHQQRSGVFRQQRQRPRQRHGRDGAARAEQQRRHEPNERLRSRGRCSPPASPAAGGRESTSPLPSTVASATNPTRQSSSCSISSGITPSTTPCSDIARMSDGSRLLPSATQVQSHRQTDQQIQSPATHAAPPFHATSNANRHSRNAVVSSSGTRRNASRASSDSTNPTPTVTARTPAASAPAAASGVSSPIGSTASRQQHGEKQELHGRAMQNHGERRPAVVQHHDFVDHRQLQMRVGIVERHAAVLRQQHGEQARRQQHRARARRR